jgi:hypothetical protein
MEPRRLPQTRQQRISIATYLSARTTLLAACRSYRQWAKSDPSRASHWLGHLRNNQIHLANLRDAERVPMLSQGAGVYWR